MTAIYIWPAVCSYHSTIETSRCLFRRSFSAPKTNAAHCRKDLIIAKWRRQIFQGKYSSQSRYNSPKRSYVNINILCVGCIRLYGLVPQSSRWYIISTQCKRVSQLLPHSSRAVIWLPDLQIRKSVYVRLQTNSWMIHVELLYTTQCTKQRPRYWHPSIARLCSYSAFVQLSEARSQILVGFRSVVDKGKKKVNWCEIQYEKV